MTALPYRLARRLPFFYGWAMLPIAMLAFALTLPGQTVGVSVFNTSFRETLDLSHTQLSGAYALGTLLASLPQAWIGSLMDRFGIRRVMLVIVVCFGLACIFISQAHNLAWLFLGFFGLRLFGQGALTMSASNSLGMWFRARLGIMQGVFGLAMAATVSVAPALILHQINRYGWRIVYASLGVGVWAILLPIIGVAYINRPEEIGQIPDGSASDTAAPSRFGENSFTLAEAMRTRAYWILLGMMVIVGMIATAITFNTMPIYISHGLTEAEAVATFAPLAISSAITQVVGGFLADRLPLSWLASACMTLQTAAIGVLMLADTVFLASFASILFGAGFALLIVSTGTAWPRYFGRANLGKITGSVRIAAVAGTSLGPLIMGALYDQLGDYDASLWLFLAMYAPLIVLALFATPPQKTALAD